MLPHRSPTPLVVPCTWAAPASTAARALATATPASLWVWMPTLHPTASAAARVAAATCSGIAPPFVSHRQTVSAPASSAARSVRIA